MSIRLSPKSKRASEILLSIRSIGCNVEKPFRLTSGWASPVYTDCRRIISFPAERREIIGLMADEIRDAGAAVVAGGETAGIPYGAWIAEALGLPMVYVRKKPKDVGRREQIEGVLEPGQKAVLVEDLATDGGSKVNFLNALRTAGATVDRSVVVFFYGIFPQAPKIIADAGITLHALTDWRTTIDVAEERKYFDPGQVREIRAFLDDPQGWSAAHGGK